MSDHDVAVRIQSAHVHASFARQGAMATLGAKLASNGNFCVAITVPMGRTISQQDGFLHAGVVVAALDTPCGYAALTLMPDNAEVLTVELKVKPAGGATGQSLVAEGRWFAPGAPPCRAATRIEPGSRRVHVATMLAETMVSRRDE